ncbi:MAG: SPFH domain-containing protein [Patescibacteria group bacterium]|nr:MAG: SPFH domain-containing protein [Patescibacteria group bacterium]
MVILLVLIVVRLAAKYRVVVPTNMVDIVQSRRNTTSYGTGQEGKNVYFAWPSWIPRIGVTVIKLPVSNFDLSLKDYEAYDKDRVPFMVDVTAFFRITDTRIAAQRVKSVEDLTHQLRLIVQGAVRKVLASDVIDEVMTQRSKFGEQFTAEVKDQLVEWGVESVKFMELMDIRDSHESRVIANIMAKKISHVEMESRQEVAKNNKQARTAEIEAEQVVDIRKQEAEQAVGERTADKDKAVGIAKETSKQEVLSAEKVTKEKEMQVKKVDEVQSAEIKKEREIVAAEEDKKTNVIRAEGQLEAKRHEASGIQAEGTARAESEKLMQLASVEAMITLAKEIGANPNYQTYLATLEAIKAYIAVGSKQAEALKNADVKVISNAGKPTEGFKGVMDIFSSQGGAELGAMVEAFAQTPTGEKFLHKLGVDMPKQPVSQEEKDVKVVKNSTE